jgi:hypothetical protein
MAVVFAIRPLLYRTNQSQLKKKVQIRKRSKKRMSGVSQVDIFHEIWGERPHKSEISGLDLDWICEDTDLWRSTFLHVLPKGRFPLYRNCKFNILIGSPEEHFLTDNGTKEQRDEYFKEKLAEGVFVDWSKFYSLQEQLKKKYPN